MSEPTPAPTPSRAVYGFAWFLFFKTLLILYICWALLPEYILQDVFGFTYLPDKYFALFFPILVLCALTVFAFLIYPPWNLSMQDDVNDLHTLRDKYKIVRCNHVFKSTGNRCENSVESISSTENNNFNRWLFEEYCKDHKQPTIENVGKVEEKTKLSKFCDCIDKSKCWLEKHSNHMRVLQKRATVSNVCDLDASDVCKEIFLDK